MDLTNYSPVYGLSAAICSAFVGIIYIPNAILTRFENKLKQQTQSVEASSNAARVLHRQLTDLHGSIHNRHKISSRVKMEIEKSMLISSQHMFWCSAIIKKYNNENLERIIKATIITLFCYGLFFNGSLLIAGGFEKDNIVSEIQSLNFLFMINISAIVCMLFLSLLTLNEALKSFAFSIAIFVATIVACFCFVKDRSEIFFHHRITDLIFSFLIFPLAIFLICFKAVWWRFVTTKFVTAKLNSQEKFKKQASELLVQWYVPTS